tara:strand:- start:277 stop:447 length:171 start_codon:yes stop_codon:yes gene_type:complete
MKIGDLIKCPAGIGLITSAVDIKSYDNGEYVFVHFLNGRAKVVVYCDTIEVISEGG